MPRTLPWPQALLALLVLGGALLAEDDAPDVQERPRPLKAADYGVGALVPDIAFTDLDGKPAKLSDYRTARGLVIACTNASCPLCKRQGPKLARLAAAFEARGVATLFLNPTPGEDLDVVRAARKAFGLPGRYVVDSDRAFAAALRVRSTGEAFLLDATRTLVYRGAVDDQYGVGYALEAPTHRYLEQAVDALLAGKPLEVPATSAPGCVLTPAEATPVAGAPTWHAQVARIVQDRCQTCHRPGENGPFSLLRYEDAKAQAGMIRYAVEERLMPPWFAAPGGLPMANDHSLAARERDQLIAWVDAGCPEGDPKDAPTPRTFVEGWRIGTPDAIVELPNPVNVPAEGVVPYQFQLVTTDFDEDRWVEAFEIRPTAPQVVHHVLVFADYPLDHPRRSDQPRNRAGIDGYFAAMVPGQTAFRFPPGTARFIPRGTRLMFQVHYTTNGTAATDRTRLGLVFAPGRPENEIQTAGLSNTRIRIPPGAPNHQEGADRTLPVAARVFGFTPHMHVRGKAFRYEAELPGEKLRVLLDIPNYDFNWQLHYRLAEPLDLPAGTRLYATAWYDNSADNPANPDPTRRVRWGDQTYDEMLIGYVDWHPILEGDTTKGR
ncbi:MAG: redoxin domain-containing protein [Planctomycetota bacterium]|nr:redoxin domain-containing protein [Planctomycetota bacterium]